MVGVKIDGFDPFNLSSWMLALMRLLSIWHQKKKNPGWVVFIPSLTTISDVSQTTPTCDRSPRRVTRSKTHLDESRANTCQVQEEEEEANTCPIGPESTHAPRRSVHFLSEAH